ncbi:B3 domain-containing protein [Hirschfeldia incana]|nr:B3 domain-containing protein [Hirschfeldia incana]
MAANDTLPRFFKVFISRLSSDSLLIPISYNDELPRTLPNTGILQGTGGCIWKVEMTKKRDEVYFGKGWNKFVTDNSLNDGDFLTFVYNGGNVFEVSIYGRDGCKEIRAVTEVEDTSFEFEMANTINKKKGKSQLVEVKDESEYEEDSDYTDTDTSCSEFTVAKTIQRSRNKGKKKKKVVESSNEDSDSDYNEASDHLCAFTESSKSVAQPTKKRERVTIKIKNPERYLVDPDNVFFVTSVKNRPYELLVHSQVVKDYNLKFEKMVYYIDNHKDGKLQAKTAEWKDHRVCIKKWTRICKRNNLKKGDGILCELKRRQGVVYAVIIHIVREKDL